MTLAACGNSRLNPLNWFGRSRAETVTASGEVNPLIPTRGGLFARRAAPPYSGAPVDTVRDLVVERVAGGAIVRATGVAATQGSWEVRLVKDEDESDASTLSYTLRAYLPAGQRVGPETGREMVAAKFVTDNDLAGIRTIRVKGARNARVTRR